MQNSDRLIRFEEVSRLVGYGRSYIYKMIREGRFPSPYKPGGISSRWSEAEVRDWVQRIKLESSS